MPNPLDLDLSSLAALQAVAQHGGLRAAARAGHSTQPTVSKRISRLEHLVGAPLLDRSRPGQLTAEGRRVLKLAERILTTAECLVQGTHAADQPALRIGVACSASEDLAVRLVTAARADGREVDLTDGTSDILVDHLRHGRVDAVLGRLDLERLPLGLSGQVIASDRLGVLCPAEHPLDRNQVAIRDLDDHPLIGFTPGLCSGLEQDLATAWTKAGATWRPVRRISGADAMLTLVQAGIGVVAIPERLAQARAGALRFRPFSDRGAVSRIVLVWSSTIATADRDRLLTWLG